MKIRKFLVAIFLLLFLSAFKQAGWAQAEMPQICQKVRNIEANRIYLCENLQGEEIYLEMFSCEDCSNLYFHLDGTFIEDCCSSTCVDEPSETCKELREYKCDYSTNLYDKICEDV